MNQYQEFISILMMGAGVILWPLGGWRQKAWRRIFFPILIGFLLMFYGLAFWRSLLCSGLLSVVASLPYGERTPWIIPNKHSSKLLTAFFYNLPALVLGWTWWMIITPMAFLTLFWLSNNYNTSKDFSWKIVEGITGIMITATIIGSLQRAW